MKTPTIRLLGISVIAATLVTGVIYVASAYMIRTEIQDSRSIWNNYQRISGNRAQALSSIIRNLGYGGMIHHFKEFLITSEEELTQKSTLSAGAALAAMERYRASPHNKAEHAALGTIRATIMAYMKAIYVANEAIMEGETTSGIDKMVKIDDGPAIKAIIILRENINSSVQQGAGQSHKTKTEQYGKMLSALGYGGMIHQFNNLIIRRDKTLAAKIKKSIDNYYTAAKSYSAMGLNEKEKKSLLMIDKAVAQYQSDLTIVTEAVKDALLPGDIFPRLNPDPKFLLQGLKSLNKAIEKQIVMSKSELTGNLKTASAFSLTVLWLAIIATGLMILLNSTIIFTRIVGPIRKIKQIMYKLSGGNMDVKILYTNRQDEIGEMARAIEVFQKNAMEVTRLEKDKLVLEELAVQKRKKTMFDLAQNFEQSVGAVVQSTRIAVKSLEETASTMHENASSSIATSR